MFYVPGDTKIATLWRSGYLQLKILWCFSTSK